MADPCKKRSRCDIHAYWASLWRRPERRLGDIRMAPDVIEHIPEPWSNLCTTKRTPFIVNEGELTELHLDHSVSMDSYGRSIRHNS